MEQVQENELMQEDQPQGQGNQGDKEMIPEKAAVVQDSEQ